MARYKSSGIWGVGSQQSGASDLIGDAVANCNLAQRCATPHYPSSFAFQIFPLEISKMDLFPLSRFWLTGFLAVGVSAGS